MVVLLLKIWPKLVLGPTLPEPSMPNRHAWTERPFATETHQTVNYWKGSICLFSWWSRLTLSKAGFFLAKSQRTKPTWILEYLNKANFWGKFHQSQLTHIFNLWNTFSDNDTQDRKCNIKVENATSRCKNNMIRVENIFSWNKIGGDCGN